MYQSENSQQHSFFHLLPHNVRAVSEAAKLSGPTGVLWSQQSCLLQKAGVALGKGGSSGYTCKNAKAGFSLSDTNCHKLLTNRKGVSVHLCDPLIISEMVPVWLWVDVWLMSQEGCMIALWRQEDYMVKTSLSFVFQKTKQRKVHESLLTCNVIVSFPENH